MNLSFHDLKIRAKGFQMRTYLRAKLQIGSTAPNFFFQNCPKISRACMGLYGRAVSVLLFIGFTLPSAVLNYQMFGLVSCHWFHLRTCVPLLR
jgi:hypothetical protein